MKTLSRRDLLALHQMGGRTEEDVLFDKHERPYVLMWSSAGDQAVYVGVPCFVNCTTCLNYIKLEFGM